MKHRATVLVLFILLCLLAAGSGAPGPEAVPEEHSRAHGTHAAAPMSDAEMRRVSEAYWATHPRVGSGSKLSPAATPNSLLGADATVNVITAIFDADGNLETQVDTVRINVGQTVLWQWQDGFHTITSGTGFDDPNAGLIFDQPSNGSNPQFSFTFTSAETVHYFCAPHEFAEMKGIVIVRSLVDVPPGKGGATLGFAADPWPNPSSSGLSFRFALAAPGRVRADVVDVRGRFVTTLVDRDYEAGAHEARWDGRAAGRRVPAGAYYLRLRVPGFVGGRHIVVTR